jgi:topoisomerase-4 subunit A
VRIRRISLFDINKSRKEVDDLVKEMKQVEKNLGRLIPYTVQYVKALLKQYGDQYPRHTQITTFEEIEVRKLTADELTIKYDKKSGYLGSSIDDGSDLLSCSSLDKLVVAWGDGRYQVMAPPDKLFVGKDMVYCAIMDRERVMTAMYTHDFTYLKRFKFGGAILNKEYRYAPEDSKAWIFQEGTPEEIYVKYKPAKGQRLHQQVFNPSEVAVKGVKARGNRMTVKDIDKLSLRKPAWWDDEDAGPRGALI